MSLKVIMSRRITGRIMASLLVGAALLLAGLHSTDALTPGQRVVLFGGQPPVLDANFAATQACAPLCPGGLTFSQTTPSTMINASGLLTYAPNNLIHPSFASGWTVQAGATLTTGIADPKGGTNAATLTVTSTAAIYQDYLGSALSVFDIGVWVNPGASPSGTLLINNSQASVWGSWSINLGSLSANTWTWINRNSPSVTILQEFFGGNGHAGFLFRVSSGTVTFSAYFPVQQQNFSHIAIAQDSVPYSGASAYFGPRYDYGCALPQVQSCGLLVWGQTVNLTPQSDLYSDASWNKNNLASVTQNATGPDGAISAWTLTDNATNDWHGLYKAVTASANQSLALSWYVAPGTQSYAFLNFGVGAGNIYATAIFDLTTAASSGTASQTATGSTSGTITATGFKKLPNGGFLIWLVGSINTANPNVVFGMANASTGNTLNAVGLPLYAGTGKTLIGYGSQAEASSFPSPYCPSGASQTTCAADVATMALPAACVNGGLMQADAMVPAFNPGAPVFVGIDDGSSANNILTFALAAGQAGAFVSAGGVTKLNVTGSVLPTNSVIRENVNWGSSTFAYANGSKIGSNGSVGVPTALTTIRFGTEISSPTTHYINGWVRRSTFWCPPPANQNFAQQKSVNW